MPAPPLAAETNDTTLGLAVPWADSGPVPYLPAAARPACPGDVVSTYPPVAAPGTDGPLRERDRRVPLHGSGYSE